MTQQQQDERAETVSSVCLLRLAEVRRRTGLSRSGIHKLISLGKFPRQIVLTRDRHGDARSVAWDNRAIDAWVAARIAEART